MQSSDPLHADAQDRRANAGFDTQKGKRFRKVLIKRRWRERAILVPPESGAVDLRLRPLRDPNFHGSFSRDDAQA